MNTLNEAINTYGERNQILKFYEEVGELMVAVSHATSGREHNVPEEIADVEVMLEQLKIIFNCHDEVAVIKRKKIERLQRNLEQKHIDDAQAEVVRLFNVKLAKYDEPDMEMRKKLWNEAVYECNAAVEINGGKI